MVEKVFGPGLHIGNVSEVKALICLSVSAGAGFGVSVHAGVYIGTGLCVKVEIDGVSGGAYAGLGYLKIDSDGFNVIGAIINQ